LLIVESSRIFFSRFSILYVTERTAEIHIPLHADEIIQPTVSSLAFSIPEMTTLSNRKPSNERAIKKSASTTTGRPISGNDHHGG
jgi:hypothetical protein